MARSWTVAEVLEGWARHYEAMDGGKLKPVRLPISKQPAYHKSFGPLIDLDFGAWTRVEALGFRDVEIREALRYGTEIGLSWAKTPDAYHALECDLARCPYPCEGRDKDPIPEYFELHGSTWVPKKEFLEDHVKIGNVWVKKTPEMKATLKKLLAPKSGRAIAAALYKARKGNR